METGHLYSGLLVSLFRVRGCSGSARVSRWVGGGVINARFAALRRRCCFLDGSAARIAGGRARGLSGKGSVSVLAQFAAPGVRWTGSVLIKNLSAFFHTLVRGPGRPGQQTPQRQGGPLPSIPITHQAPRFRMFCQRIILSGSRDCRNIFSRPGAADNAARSRTTDRRPTGTPSPASAFPGNSDAHAPRPDHQHGK